MFVDKVTISIKAGNGGNGAVSFRRSEGNPRGGPDGGNGGNGGDVYIRGINDLTALSQFQFKKKWKAEDGVAGKRKNLFGKNADDLIIDVPIGTTISHVNGERIVDINDTDSRYCIAKGGKGGRGNNEFKSATNQTPQYAESGEIGEEVEIELELKLIAQVGIIGLPNAGKSTLLSCLTNAHPKIGDYPFTTLEPNVGMMDGYMLADIPGLIEGASTGKGLGIRFLKHIEKTLLIIHCIDSSEGDVENSYKIVMSELESFNVNLLEKKQILVLTKTDKISKKELRSKIAIMEKYSSNILSVNIYDANSIQSFKEYLLNALAKNSLPTSTASASESST
ncbi:MAG: GTPase ObgE [Candidatus Levybacteria bacterium]|nr:GTPase ObgE [Candidatus Levybacteria bacterium]